MSKPAGRQQKWKMKDSETSCGQWNENSQQSWQVGHGKDKFISTMGYIYIVTVKLGKCILLWTNVCA